MSASAAEQMRGLIPDGLKSLVDDLYARHAEVICDGDIEAWPDLFTDDCLYHVKSRANHERDQLLGPIFSESKGALIDRVVAIRNSMVFMPRAMCYVVGSIRIVDTVTGRFKTRSMFSAYHTLESGDSELLMVGRTFDQMVESDAGLKFAERLVIFDTERVPGALIYPI